MKLYTLEWHNGERFCDIELTLLGIYTSPESRAAARARYDASSKDYWPFTSRGYYLEWDHDTDVDLVSIPPDLSQIQIPGQAAEEG